MLCLLYILHTCAHRCSFSCVKNVPSDVWKLEHAGLVFLPRCSGWDSTHTQKSQRDRWRARRGQTDVWERDLERLLTLQQARGKSSQAISKLSHSAPATLAPHNYNTIWQRYWAQIPCYFCRCVYPARAWFYIKVPKMALAVTYWKERPCSQAEWANTVRICWLSWVQQRQHRGRVECSPPCPRWRTCFCKGDLFLHTTSKRLNGGLVQGGVI